MITTQVLIVGAGPAGMISALSLAQAGVRCVLVDKRLERLAAPKAHAVNPRTLEICERLGVSADAIRASGASIEDGGEVHFVDVLAGQRFGSLPYERQDEGARKYTPWPLVNIAQPVFETFLSARLSQCAGVSLLRGMRATQIDSREDAVVVTLNGAGVDEDVTVQADYVIAADGASSDVRQMLDIGMTGPEALQDYMMIHFEADLRTLTQAHPGLLYFCMSPTAQGVFIGYDRARTWVFMQSYDKRTQNLQDFDEARCRTLIEAAAGARIDDLSIQNVSPWTMSAQVADTYRQDRVFLVGDAAHRFPPTGGLGLNTGVADAHNLGWKLSAVLNGSASPALLDTYELERRPVAQINSEQSVTNSAKLLHLFLALHGPDPEQTSTYYQRVCADLSAHPGVAEAVEIQRPHFDSFNLQLGYRYGAEAPAELDISCYQPDFCPGSYLPLLPVQEGPWLLGLLPTDQFALVTGKGGDMWANANVAVLQEGCDFRPVAPFCEWAGLRESGALLIRPDGHICARWEAAPADPAEAVASHVARVLKGT